MLLTGYNSMKTTKEELGRYDLVFNIIDILVTNDKYLEAYKFIEEEFGHLKNIRSNALKLKTYACDAVVIALILGDGVLAEKSLEQFTDK